MRVIRVRVRTGCDQQNVATFLRRGVLKRRGEPCVKVARFPA